MYIIIAGAGVVGFHIASLLVEGKHEVTVVEPSEEVVENIRRQLDVKTIVGYAATPRILREAEVNRADLIIAVGPLVSAPWVGEMPSETGSPAFRPFGSAPVT